MRAAGGRLPRREGLVLIAVGMLLFAGGVAVARFNFDTSDEGLMLYFAVQAGEGKVPFRDFNTFYTPFSFYLHALLFRVTGVEVIPVRVLFSALASGLALGVYGIARQFTGPAFAAVPVIAYVLVFPIPRIWTPYPAWFALAGLMLALIGGLTWLGDRRRRWLVLTGVGCALAFANKSNVGAFAVLAAGTFLLLQARTLHHPREGTAAGPGGSRLALLQLAVVLATVAAFWLLLRGAATPGNVVLFLAPLAACGLLLLETSAAGGPGRAALADAARNLGWVVGTFVALTLPWYSALAIAAGWRQTFDGVFLIGTRAASAPSFYAPILLPNPDAVETFAFTGLGLVAVGLVGWASRGGRGRARLLGTGTVLVLAAGATWLAWRAGRAGVDLLAYLALNVSTRFQRLGLEETDFLTYVPLAVLWLAIGVLGWGRWRGEPVDPWWLRLRFCAWFLALYLFQFYPRASFMHVLFAIGPSLALLGALRARLWQWALGRRSALGWKLAALLPLLVFPAVLVPGTWWTRAEALKGTRPLDVPHASGLLVPEEVQTRLRFASRALADLAPGAPIFAYPSISAVYLFLDHPNPTRENHLPGGYWGEDRQREVIGRLESTQPRYVVWDQALVDKWGLYGADFLLVDYIWTRYVPVGAERRWVVLRRQE